MATGRFRVIVIMALAALAAIGGCAPQVKRVGSVIGIPKDNIVKYKELHANTWPGVLKMIRNANICNYSIYLGEVAGADAYYLFSYYEYVGNNFDKDMARIAKDPTTKKWWKETDPLQKPLPTRKEGEWWATWEEVFHHDGPAYGKKEIESRHGSIIGISQENLLAYTQLHAAVWPGVLAAIDRANIRNYSIYLGQLTPGEYLLFSYFEYVGDDFQADMKVIAKDKVTQTWWRYTDPLQQRLPGTPQGDQWKTMEEVFHTD